MWKNKRILAAILIVLLLSIIIVLGIFFKENTTIIDSQISYNKILPGQDSNESVIAKLGNPDSEGKIDDKIVLNYKVEGRDSNTQVILKENQVDMVKQIIGPTENVKKSDFEKYGEPEATYYGPHYNAGFRLYSYSSKGLAIIAHWQEQTVYQVWYFKPVKTDEFLSTIASNERYSSQEEPMGY